MHWLPTLGFLASSLHTVRCIDLNIVNANHIFNAIHDSMRQFGNSLNHNGMSIFLATVPKDTELYHGTSTPWRINGTQWLAFEPEHGLVFAGAPVGPPPSDTVKEPHHLQQGRLQQLLGHAGQPPPDERPQVPGYFHTYRTKHELRLLYVDGQSAAKSSKGTLDTQDYVLLPKPPSSTPGEWLPFEDLARAKALCRMAETEWQGRIDGILRMEAGFEIILCDFEKHLDVVRIVEAKDVGDRDEDVNGEVFNYLQAVAARYDGIGGGRVRIDYNNFITLFDHPEAIYFDQTDLPRVTSTSTVLPVIRRQVKDLATGVPNMDGINWQQVTDMVVSRDADRIAYMTSASLHNMSELQTEADRALRPFIDYNSRNATAEIERCAVQPFPGDIGTISHSVAYLTILNVTTSICSTFSSILSDEMDFFTALRKLQDLKKWLRWATWKRCRSCGYHEICFVPLWPIGSKEDFEQPKCQTNVLDLPNDYWWDDFETLPLLGEK